MRADKTAYRGLPEGGPTWRLLHGFWSIAVSNATVSRDVKRRSKETFVTDIVRDAFGDEPDLESRHLSAIIPTSILALISVGMGGLGLAAVLVLNLVGVDGYTAGMAGLVGLFLLGAPFVSMFIWAVRGTLSELHHRSWAKRDRPSGELPPRASQPRDRDLLIGLPWAIVMLGLAAYFAVEFINSAL